MFLLKIDAKSFSAGFAMGFGSGFVARELAASGNSVIKPATKNLIKSILGALQRSRESMAHFAEAFEDLVAEAKSELESDTELASVDSAETRSAAQRASAADEESTPVRATRQKKRGRR